MITLREKSLQENARRKNMEQTAELRYRHETTAERTANWPMRLATIEDAERIFGQASLTPQNN